MSVEIGQQYRCKRRGHVLTVVWTSAAINLAAVESSSGRRITMKLDRLMKPYRFALVVQPAKFAASAEETPIPQEPAHAPQS